MVAQMRDHPSNRLARGEVHDFLDACATYEAAIREEISQGYVFVDGSAGFWSEQITQVRMAARIYEQCQREGLDDIALNLRGHGLDMFATALETGDYSRWAI